MAVPAVSGALKKYWVVLVIVVALFSAGVVVARLRTFFDSDQPLAPDVGHADAIVPFNVKRVTYQIVGPQGTNGRVSYLDDKGRTHEESFTDLPWSTTVSTTDPGLLANIVAQGDSSTLGCRILVNDKVVDQQDAQGHNAQTFCLDKAA